MKKLLFLILAVTPIFALKSRQVVFSAANPLPTSYSTSNTQSLVLSEVGTSNKNLIFLTTATDVVCHLSGKASNTVPTSSQEVFLVASEPMPIKDIGGVANIYCKSSTAAKTTGWLSVLAY